MKSILASGLQIPFLLGCLALSPAHSASGSAPAPPLASSPATTPPAARTAPLLDPLTGLVHSTLLRSGVPLGGIGTGSFQLRTDGTVGRVALGGITQRPLAQAPGCFAALWTRTERGTTAQTLALTNAYHLPTVAKLDYDGLFPQANLSFPDPQSPVQTNLLAFSPLVPFDLKNSSFPAVAYVLRLKNLSQNPVEVSVALSWENLLANSSFQTVSEAVSQTVSQTTSQTAGAATIIPSNGGYFGATFSPTGSEDTMTLLAYPDRAETVVTTALWDAADPTPTWWERFAREGTVADPQNPTPTNTPNTQRPTPNVPTCNASVSVPNAQRPTPNALPSSNAPTPPSLPLHRPGAVTAMRLVLKPGELVELPFAVSWYAKHQYGPSGVDVGHYYEVAFTGAEDAGRQLLADWRSLYGLTEEWQKRLIFSNLPRWSARRMIDAAAPLATNTIHTRDGRFTFQNRAQNAMEQEATRQKSSLLHTERTERLDTLSHEAIEPLLLTLYPQLAAQELTQLSALLDGRGLLPPPASADWFVRLGLALPKHTAQNRGGGIQRVEPQPLYAGSGTKRLPGVPHAGQPAPLPPTPVSPALDPLDANADYLLAMTRFALWTGDLDFIKPHTSNIQRAARALIGLRTATTATTVTSAAQGNDGGTRGLTLQGNYKGNDGGTRILNPASFSHWLAAVRASQRLAGLLGDTVLERLCADAVREGSAQMDSSLWNGEFYAQSPLPISLPNIVRSGAAPTPESVCSSDQLWGQWIAYQLGLGPLLPTAHLLRASQSIQQRNDRMSANPPPPTSLSASTPASIPASVPFAFQWQVRTDGQPLETAEDTATACLLPASVLSDASVALWQNQPEVAMAQLLGLENLRNNLLRSPWQYPALLDTRFETKPNTESNTGLNVESEANSTSLAVASDWSILYALQGFNLDINRGELALTPHLPGYWQTFSTPIFAPTFWGRMEYRPTAHGGTLTFRLDRLIAFIATPAQTLLKNRAELTLRTLRVPGPPPAGKTPPTSVTAHVSHGRNPLGCRATLDPDGAVTILFDSPLTMTAGDRLQVDIR